MTLVSVKYELTCDGFSVETAVTSRIMEFQAAFAIFISASISSL